MKTQRLIPMLPVRNMPASVEFYTRFGFRVESRNDEWRWAILAFDDCRLMLDESIHQPPDIARTAVVYLYPDDIFAYHREMRRRGLDVPQITHPSYGMSEFRMEGPDGNRLWIEQKNDVVE